MTEWILVLVLAIGIAGNVCWSVYLSRNRKSAGTMSADELRALESRVERMLSEIHRVTSANVEFLESRIDALREVGGLADERLKRIRTSLTDLEVLLNRVTRVKSALGAKQDLSGNPGLVQDEDSAMDTPRVPSELNPSPILPPASPRSEIAQTLLRQGLTERQVAQKMGLGLPEIRFLLKLADPIREKPSARPVESL